MSFTYRATTVGVPALADVSLEIGPGAYVAVLGANGSGKSTLVRLVNGLLVPDSGEVSVDGLATVRDADVSALRRFVSMVFQNPDDQIVATSVEDDVAFGPENLGLERETIRERVRESLAAVGLTGLESREPHLLSGGQKQRLAIAGALAMDPRYLVLDEPTSMLDPKGRHEVLDVLDDVVGAGRCVVHVTHDLTEAMRASRAIVLQRGSVVYDGPPAALLGGSHPIEQWGLEVPPLHELVGALRAQGIDVRSAVATPTQLVRALCR